MKFWLSFICFCIFFGTVYGQTSDDSSSLKSSLVTLPLVFRTPETSWGFGLGAAYNFYMTRDTLGLRPSQLQAGAVYTLEQQVLLYFPFQIFLDQNRYLAKGELGYYYYFYRFYGIGNETSVDEEEFYLASFPRVKISLAWASRPNLFIGVTYDFDRFRIREIAEEGLIDNNDYIGSHGAIISEPGVQLIYDTRDFIFYASDGWFLQLDGYASLSENEDSYRYGGVRIDARWYRQLWAEHTLAFQVIHEQQYGDVPFFRLANLGGSRNMRGYMEGRFRDQSMFSIQAAYRFPIFWRIYGELFGAIGEVANSPRELLHKPHWAGGAGLRLRVDRSNRLHLRVDFAFGEDQTGFYITLGEAF